MSVEKESSNYQHMYCKPDDDSIGGFEEAFDVFKHVPGHHLIHLIFCAISKAIGRMMPINTIQSKLSLPCAIVTRATPLESTSSDILIETLVKRHAPNRAKEVKTQIREFLNGTNNVINAPVPHWHRMQFWLSVCTFILLGLSFCYACVKCFKSEIYGESSVWVEVLIQGVIIVMSLSVTYWFWGRNGYELLLLNTIILFVCLSLNIVFASTDISKFLALSFITSSLGTVYGFWAPFLADQH